MPEAPKQYRLLKITESLSSIVGFQNQNMVQMGAALLKIGHPKIESISASPNELLIKHSMGLEVLPIISKVEIDVDQAESNSYHLPIFYDDDWDWAFVESHCNISKDSYINRLGQVTFKLEMFGFIPGFCYLEGLPTNMRCPRKVSPRQRVPEGAIALGGRYAGIYDLVSPGGWQIIGRTPVRISNTPQMPPSFLAVGDELQFKRIARSDFEILLNKSLTILEYNDQIRNS